MKVLVVDDEEVIRKLFKQMLEMKHCTYTIVGSGREAIEEVKEGSFDVVFLDIVMPDMDGVETLKNIREINPELPAVMITGHAVEDRIKKAIQFENVEYLFKPFDITDVFLLLDVVSKEHHFEPYPEWYDIEDIRRSHYHDVKGDK